MIQYLTDLGVQLAQHSSRDGVVHLYKPSYLPCVTRAFVYETSVVYLMKYRKKTALPTHILRQPLVNVLPQKVGLEITKELMLF